MDNKNIAAVLPYSHMSATVELLVIFVRWWIAVWYRMVVAHILAGQTV